MAGSFPNVPGQRFAYDIDGSQFFFERSGNLDAASNLAKDIANNESDDPTYVVNSANWYTNQTIYVVLLFPEERDISGIYWSDINPSSAGALFSYQDFEYSTDTVTGFNSSGTWQSAGIGDMTRGDNTPFPYYRENITSLSLTGVKALRVVYSRNGDGSGTTLAFRNIHIYGSIPSAYNADQLKFWHPTLNQEVDGHHFDFADVTRGQTSSEIDFRIRNISPSLQANTVNMSFTDLETGEIADWAQLSADGGSTWTTTVAIGDIASATTEATVYKLRLVIPNNTDPKAYSGRIELDISGGWS